MIRALRVNQWEAFSSLVNSQTPFGHTEPKVSLASANIIRNGRFSLVSAEVEHERRFWRPVDVNIQNMLLAQACR